jgi:hypothetical protein
MRAIICGPTLQDLRSWSPAMTALMLDACASFDRLPEAEQQAWTFEVNKAAANGLAVCGLQTALES